MARGDHLATKSGPGDQFSQLKSAWWTTFGQDWFLCDRERKKMSVIRSSRVSAIQGVLMYQVYGETVGAFRIVRYIVGVRC